MKIIQIVMILFNLMIVDSYYTLLYLNEINIAAVVK